MAQHTKTPRPYPFSIRLTFEERAYLTGAAGNMPLGAYIRKKILSEVTELRRRRVYRPVKDNQALARLLAELGKSHLANNLNQMAKAVNSGSLQVTPETEKAIIDAYVEIIWMRQTLVTALGFEPGSGSDAG